MRSWAIDEAGQLPNIELPPPKSADQHRHEEPPVEPPGSI